VERFILLEGGIYTTLFWFGQIVLGSLARWRCSITPPPARARTMVGLASLLVILGGWPRCTSSSSAARPTRW
jgi:hypothetical protein